MANLFGTGINQVPTNGMLGNLAFQDKAYVSVDKVGIGTTAVDTGTANQTLQNYGGAYVSGNLGVGSTNPTSTLQVTGTFYNSGIGTFANGNTTYGTGSASSLELGINNNNNAGTLKIWGATSNAYGIIQATTSNLHIDTVVGGTYLNYYDGDFISFGTGAVAESARFTGSTGTLTLGTITPTGTSSQLLQVTGGAYVSGNLGIGNTNGEGIKLFVSQGAPSANRPVALITDDGTIPTMTGGATLRISNDGSINSFALLEAESSVGRLVFTNAGNLGIGTTNPGATLQVKDALAFETTNTTTTSTSQVAVDTFATATFRSAKYQVQITCPGQISVLGGITTGGRGYTAGTYNVTFTTSSGNGSAAQGTLTISNGTVGVIGLGTTGGSGYAAGDVLTASGGSGFQVSVATTASPSGAILTLGSITSAGIGYTGYYNTTTGTGTTSLAFLGGTGTGAVGLATIFDGVITSSTLLQQPTTGTGGTVYYSGSNYSTASVLSVTRSDLTNTITTITGSVGVSTFTSLTAHGIGVSDVVRVSSTSNGLTAGTDYYVVTTPTTTTFTLGTAVGVGTTFTAGTSLAIGFFRNSARDGGQVAYTNAITGVSTNYQVSDLLVLQNGSTVDYVEYAGIANNDILGTFAADISGANARLLLTPTYPNNTVKVARQVMTV